MDARSEVRAAVQLTADERTALDAAAASGNVRVALVAGIVLACVRGEPDAAVAAAFGVSVRTVVRWRQRFRSGGVRALGDAGRPGADDLVRAAFMDDGPAGSVPTTRSAAGRLGVSQATVARAWRAAGVRPLPAGLLVGDPWFRGHSRAIAGFAVLSAPDPARDVPVVGTADTTRPLRSPAARRALAFWVAADPSTPRRRATEDALVMASRDRERLWDSAASWCRATEELSARAGARAAVRGGSAADLAGFVRDLDDRRPEGTATWVLLDGLPEAEAGETSGAGEAQVRCAPSAATWSALAVRGLAATAAALEARGAGSCLPRMETAARVLLAGSPSGGPWQWREDPDAAAGVLSRLRRRKSPPPRRAEVPRLSPGEALERLREAHPEDADRDLAPFEQLVLIRRRSAAAGAGDVGAAHAVLAGLERDCDVLEGALLEYCRQPQVRLDPWLVARRLGLTTRHAVGQRARARAAGAAGGRRSAASRVLPDPREAGQPDERGRRRDVAGETVESLLELWREDLVDAEHLVERLPAADDRFGILAWLVHPDRPVLRDWRPDRPGPRERHRAAADAGLVLLADLRHRLRDEQLWWTRAGIEGGVSWRVQGDAWGRSPNAALQHWKRLEERARGDGTPDPGAERTSGEWWAAREDAVVAAIASVLEFRELLEGDDDLGMYVWWLEETPGPVPLLAFLDDFAAERHCEDCGADRAMVVRDENGHGRCPAHEDHAGQRGATGNAIGRRSQPDVPGLAATAARLRPLAAELQQLRRAAR
uniref:helix-turn-helix domain-containing protein n=1 Tax=Amycolatopsis sp. CA-096443 TaxID=3239919 RepID=UPI003F495BE3